MSPNDVGDVGGLQTIRHAATPNRAIEATLPYGEAVVVASGRLGGGGGVATVCRAMVRALVSTGLRVGYVDSSERIPGVTHRRLPGRRVWLSTAEALAPRRKLSRKRPDIVVTNGPIGWGARGCQLSVHMYHGAYAGLAEATRHTTRRRGNLKMRVWDSMVLERFAGRGKLCVANSDRTAAEIERLFGHRCAVVWCPVDTERFTPGPEDAKLLRKLNLTPRQPVGLFVGAGRPEKGERTAYAVMERVPDSQWLVVGSGKTIPPSLNSRVVVVPSVPPETVPRLLRSVDVVLAPSLYEAFGLVVAEALACGTPVVSTLSGAADMLLRTAPLDRFFVPDVGDVEALTQVVRSILEDPVEARSVALVGRSRVHATCGQVVWAARFLKAIGLQ